MQPNYEYQIGNLKWQVDFSKPIDINSHISNIIKGLKENQLNIQQATKILGDIKAKRMISVTHQKKTSALGFPWKVPSDIKTIERELGRLKRADSTTFNNRVNESRRSLRNATRSLRDTFRQISSIAYARRSEETRRIDDACARFDNVDHSNPSAVLRALQDIRTVIANWRQIKNNTLGDYRLDGRAPSIDALDQHVFELLVKQQTAFLDEQVAQGNPLFTMFREISGQDPSFVGQFEKAFGEGMTPLLATIERWKKTHLTDPHFPAVLALESHLSNSTHLDRVEFLSQKLGIETRQNDLTLEQAFRKIAGNDSALAGVYLVIERATKNNKPLDQEGINLIQRATIDWLNANPNHPRTDAVNALNRFID